MRQFKRRVDMRIANLANPLVEPRLRRRRQAAARRPEPQQVGKPCGIERLQPAALQSFPPVLMRIARHAGHVEVELRLVRRILDPGQ